MKLNKFGALITLLLCLVGFVNCVTAQDEFPKSQLSDESIEDQQVPPDNVDHAPGGQLPSFTPAAQAQNQAPTVAPAAATLVAKMVGDVTSVPATPTLGAVSEAQLTPITALEPTIEPDPQDLDQLKLEMALTSFKLNPDSRTRAMAIDGYQGLVIKECYSQVYKNLTLVPPGTPKCQSLVAKLLQFEPQNPLAICAREGFESNGCRNAYRGQSFKSISIQSDDTELDQVLDMKRSEQELSELQNKISNLRSDYEIHQDLDSRTALMTELERAMEKSCRNISEAPAEEFRDGSELFKKYPELEKIVSGKDSTQVATPGSLANMIEPTEVALSEPTPKSQEKPFAGLLKDLSNESAEGKVNIVRYRNASPFCFSFVSQVLEFEPQHARATCLRDGPYSPSCLAAVKKQRENPVANSSGKQNTITSPAPRRQGAGSLGTF